MTCWGFCSCTSASKLLSPRKRRTACWRRSPPCRPTTHGWKNAGPSCCSKWVSIASAVPSWRWPSRSTAPVFIPARERLIRVLERQEDYAQAMALACAAQEAPESPAEQQHLLRVLPRLRRKLGAPALPKV